jgi:hypothetical protein
MKGNNMSCEHEWVNPYPQLREFWNIRRCIKCGVEGKILKCRVCREDTIHIPLAFESKRRRLRCGVVNLVGG